MVKISPSYSNFNFKNQLRYSFISPSYFNFKKKILLPWVTAVDKKVNLNMTSRDLIRYTGEIILLGSDSQSVQGLIPPQVNLSGV